MLMERFISLDDIPALATELIGLLKDRPVLLFYGELGAGKTTLIKEICKQLGTDDLVSSPTFSLVNEYQSKRGSIYHFDLYRLKDVAEAWEIGIDEYFHSGNICLVEWPEKALSLLPERYLEIRLYHVPGKEEIRSLSMEMK